LLAFEQTGQFHSDRLPIRRSDTFGADEWIVLLLPMFRATSMSNGVSNARSLIFSEAILKARFVNNMDARPDCELPHHLAELGVALWMSKDSQVGGR